MKKLLTILLTLLLTAALICGGLLLIARLDREAPTVHLDPKNPQVLTLWHYYNGTHQQAFDQLMLTFNETEGRQKGVIIEARSLGSVDGLNSKLLAAARGEYGEGPMPDIFSAYADMAWDVNKIRPLADLRPYFTDAELDAYVAPYIQEGYLTGSDALIVFPIAKSTEVLMLNRTEWYLFSTATGADASLLSTWEGIREVSRLYHEWTDGLTPDVPDDGRAFFGLDSCANYLIIASQQLGVEMFSVEDGVPCVTIDAGVMRKVWDTFVVPSVGGWYGAYGAYRTDDMKTGRLAAIVGSTSGAIYFPDAVTRGDGTSYAIMGECLPMPVFEGATPCAVQQGAGMAVTASNPLREQAASVFLKWFTSESHNTDFAISSGYLPVTAAANDPARLNRAMDAARITGMLRDGLLTGARMTGTHTLYTSPVFDGCYEARAVLDATLPAIIAECTAERDRLISAGMDRREAIALATDDAAFSTWLTQLRQQIADTLK